MCGTGTAIVWEQELHPVVRCYTHHPRQMIPTSLCIAGFRVHSVPLCVSYGVPGTHPLLYRRTVICYNVVLACFIENLANKLPSNKGRMMVLCGVCLIEGVGPSSVECWGIA